MILKYEIVINNEVIVKRFKNLINQVYKLLPIREQGAQWKKPLQTILQELAGMQRLLKMEDSEFFFILISKLEGLYLLNLEEDFSCYRRIIFECLNLMNSIQKECLQNH